MFASRFCCLNVIWLLNSLCFRFGFCLCCLFYCISRVFARFVLLRWWFVFVFDMLTWDWFGLVLLGCCLISTLFVFRVVGLMFRFVIYLCRCATLSLFDRCCMGLLFLGICAVCVLSFLLVVNVTNLVIVSCGWLDCYLFSCFGCFRLVVCFTFRVCFVCAS